MNADLKWLAENVSEWSRNGDLLFLSHMDGFMFCHPASFNARADPDNCYSQTQWQAARDELEKVNLFEEARENTLDNLKEGKINTYKDPSGNRWRLGSDGLVTGMCAPVQDPFSSPDEDEAWLAAEERMDIIGHNGATGEHYEKQDRYKDDQGEDWIDEAARTLTAEEFRGAMRFTIGKYNRRMGKKDDLISEIEKMRDYCTRWLEVEQGR